MKHCCERNWEGMGSESQLCFQALFHLPTSLLGWAWASPTLVSSRRNFSDIYTCIYICRYVSYVVRPMHVYAQQMWAICAWSNNTDVLCYLVGARGDIRARQLERSHWKVYRARAINIQLCGKAQLTEHIEGGRDFVPCWCDDFLAIPKDDSSKNYAWLSDFVQS